MSDNTSLISAIEELIAAWKKFAQKKQPGQLMPFLVGGSTRSEFERHGQRMGRAVPDEVALLYESIDGVCGRYTTFVEVPGELIHILPLYETEWTWADDDMEILDPEWKGNGFYRFASSKFGDSVYYYGGESESRWGTIILHDHECSNQNPSPVRENCYTTIIVLADSLTSWLRRWIACGLGEFAFDDVTGEWGVSKEVEIAYLKDYSRLNPRLDWPKERLARYLADNDPAH